MTKDVILKTLKNSPHYSHQWDNYDVRSDEAKSLLSRLGLVVDGRGEYVCDALLGFYADDSGFRSRNLDYAKAYSGYRADKGVITVRCAADDEEDAMKAAYDAYCAPIDAHNKKIRDAEDKQRFVVMYEENIKKYEKNKKMWEERLASDPITIYPNARKWKASYNRDKFLSVDDARAAAKEELGGYIAEEEEKIKETKEKIAEAKKILEESKNIKKIKAMSFDEFCEKWKKENSKA